jgi:hypothetical protein
MSGNRRLDEFRFQVAVAVVGGLLVAAVVAFCGYLISISGHGTTSRVPQSVNAANSSHASLLPSVATEPSSRGRVSASVPPSIETPANQDYFLLWHQIIVVGFNGIDFDTSGPSQGDGTDFYTLEYNTVTGSGWNSNDQDFLKVPVSLTPGPATCVAMTTEYSSPPYVKGLAVKGDRYCDVEFDTNGVTSLVVYAQVLGVAGTNVTLDAWAWNL